MFQTRVHGRGGQGVAATAAILAAAARRRGRPALTRREALGRKGAAVVASCRIGSPAGAQAPMGRPDAVIVADASLLGVESVLAGLGPEGYLLVNSATGLGELGCADQVSHLCRDRLLVLPATRIAVTHTGRPAPGAPLLGGLCALTGVVGVEDLAWALRERFGPAAGEANAAAARVGHAFIAAEREALSAL